jgi:hypothetical protein
MAQQSLSSVMISGHRALDLFSRSDGIGGSREDARIAAATQRPLPAACQISISGLEALQSPTLPSEQIVQQIGLA